MNSKLKYLFALTVAGIVGLVTFGGVAVAAGAAEPTDGSLLDLLKPVLDAFRGGQYVYAGALALVLAVAAVKHYGGNRFPWLLSDIGSSILALLGSFAATLSVALGTGSKLGLGLLWTAGGVAVAAAGGYSLIKKLVIEPLIASNWYKNAPSWVVTGMDVVLWIFGEATSSPIPAAEKAGTDAVAAHPAGGTAAVVGTPTEIK